MDTGSILVLVAMAILTAAIILRPFIKSTGKSNGSLVTDSKEKDQKDHQISSLLAEKERLLNAIQELEFDHQTGKIPDELFPEQRMELLQNAASVLQKLSDLGIDTAGVHPDTNSTTKSKTVTEYDDLEELIARRRTSRKEKTTGFCPKCGKIINENDRFCPKCGTTIQSSR